MKKKLFISIIQSKVFWENKEKNRVHFSAMIDKVQRESDLIVLPEMFNTGFSLKPEKNYEEINGKTISWMREKAREKKCSILGSIIIKHENKFFNRFIFMPPDGKLSFYDKKHLFRMAGEHEHYSAGNKNVIVNYKGWRIRLLVCYDLRFPVWSRNKNNYDLLIYVANWPTSRIFQWNALLTARAIENQAYVVGVNRIGDDGNNFIYSGSSEIINPKGENLINAEPNQEFVQTIEIDYDLLDKYRENFPVSRDADEFIINN